MQSRDTGFSSVNNSIILKAGKGATHITVYISAPTAYEIFTVPLNDH